MIPTGHDKPLTRSALPHTPSLLTPLVPSPHPSHTLSPLSTSTEPSREFQDLEHYPYQPFFHMYKPVTKYKKSNPPPPDFRIVVVKYISPLPLPSEIVLIYSLSITAAQRLPCQPSSNSPRCSPQSPSFPVKTHSFPHLPSNAQSVPVPPLNLALLVHLALPTHPLQHVSNRSFARFPTSQIGSRKERNLRNWVNRVLIRD